MQTTPRSPGRPAPGGAATPRAAVDTLSTATAANDAAQLAELRAEMRRINPTLPIRMPPPPSDALRSAASQAKGGVTVLSLIFSKQSQRV